MKNKFKNRKDIVYPKTEKGWDNPKYHTVKAIFSFDAVNCEYARYANNKIFSKSKLMGLDGRECLVEINEYELGFYLSKSDEYDVIFDQGNNKKHKIIIFGSCLKLI